MHRTLIIAAPAQRVWSLTEDVEAWPTLTTTMLRVERREDGPLRSALATENDGFRRAAEGLERPRFVDEHRTTLNSSPEQAWAAVRRYADTLTSAGGRRWLTGLLGTEPTAGFEVNEEVSPRLLSLAGRHRFARYVLDLRIHDRGGGVVDVSAVTYADFPGVHGRTYRLAVVGSRGHVVAVRRIRAGIRSLL